MFKAVVIIIFLAILGSLGSGLFYLTNDKGDTKRTVNALTVRVALSVALFALLFLAWWMGWIEPHGVGQ